MSARSGAFHEVRSQALHVGLVAVPTVLLAIGIAVAIWFPRTMADRGSVVVPHVTHAYSTNQTKESVLPEYRIRPHGPDQMPKRPRIHDSWIGPHGSDQMPKR
jgi:hypothetical protein